MRPSGLGAVQVIVVVLLAAVPAWLFGRHSRAHVLLYVMLVLCSMAVVHNFRWGQFSSIVVVCVLAALVLYERGHRTSVGALIALGAAVKIWPGLLLIYFLIKRDWRVIGGFAGAVVVMAVGGIAVLGPVRRTSFSVSCFAGWSPGRC